MPYQSNQDLPEGVRKKYSSHQQEAFRKAFNSAMESGEDEETCFQIAHHAAQQAGEKDVEGSIVFEQISGKLELMLEASVDNGDIMIFRDARLVKAKRNKNGDHVGPAGIEELAATIAGRAIDYEHHINQIVGTFTSGRPTEGKEALIVGGFIWADRWPEVASGIKNGEYKLSVEATAEKATCSECGAEFVSATDYCAHLKDRKRSGASRMLYGLKAKGGAVTRNPAEVEATFGDEIYMVASHQEDNGADVEGVAKREDVSETEKKSAEKEYGDVTYADEKNKKYPVDKEGPPEAAKQKEEASMADEPTQAQDQPVVDIKAQYEATITELNAKLEQYLQRIRALEERVTNDVLAKVFTPDEIAELKPRLAGLSIEQIELIASVGDRKPKPASGLVVDQSAPTQSQPTKPKLTL